MSKKRRQTVTMILLCLLLIGAGISYYAIIRHQKAQSSKTADTDTDTDETIPVYKMKDSSITKIHFTSDLSDLTIVKKGKKWENAKDSAYPLDQSKADSMLDAVASVDAQKLVTDTYDDLDQYGLKKPALQVEVTSSSGEKQTLYIGEESLAGGGRYAYCKGSKKIYLINTTIYSAFAFTDTQLMEVADLPEITADYVTHLKVSGSKGKGFEATYDAKNSPYKSIYSWAINAPYSQAVPGDVDQLATLFESFAKLSYSECADYKADDAACKKYGLDHPAYQITLDYFQVKGETSGDDTTQTAAADVKDSQKIKKTLTLLIGHKTKDKESYYVMQPGSKAVYLMSKDTVDAMVKIDAIKYVYTKLYAGNEMSLNSIDLNYQGKDYHMTLSSKEKKDKTYAYTAKVDGKKVDDQEFRNAYAAFSEITAKAGIDSSVKTVSDKAVATIVFHEKKRNVTLTFYPYDGKNFYRVKVDDVMQFVTDMNEVDSALNTLAALSK